MRQKTRTCNNPELIFIMSSLGAFLGIWLGLLLTTPAAPFPGGLPFALATVNITAHGPQFAGTGWRWWASYCASNCRSRHAG